MKVKLLTLLGENIALVAVDTGQPCGSLWVRGTLRRKAARCDKCSRVIKGEAWRPMSQSVAVAGVMRFVRLCDRCLLGSGVMRALSKTAVSVMLAAMFLGCGDPNDDVACGRCECAEPAVTLRPRGAITLEAAPECYCVPEDCG